MRLLLTGGGTGGHIYPALTIGKEFLRRAPKAAVLYVGGKKGLETSIVPKEGFPLLTLELSGIPRRLSPAILRSLWLAGKGVKDTFKIIREFKPDFVIGTGGYVCGPVVAAAALMGIPTGIQEQNAYPGLTNRLLGNLVKRIFLAYPEGEQYFNSAKVKITGNPIRQQEFSQIKREAVITKLGLKKDDLNLLIFGGSQSAQKMNETFIKILSQLIRRYPRLNIFLMTGTKDFEKIKKSIAALGLTANALRRLHIEPYFYNIAEIYAISDLVFARAGAISLAEITCFGIPAILVPYPHATNNHQEHNARVLEKEQAAQVILEQELTTDNLYRELVSLLDDSSKRKAMQEASRRLGQPEATTKIVDEILKQI